MQKNCDHALSLLAAAIAGIAFAGPALAAYQVNPAVTLPLVSTDGTAAATATTYTAISALTSLTRADHPNGSFGSLVVGALSGTTNDAAKASIGTAFAYDPINGFRLIGRYTVTSTGSHVNPSVRTANNVGQVIGSSPVNSPNSSTSGVLGTEAWLYSTAGNTNVSLGLTGPNFSYTLTVPANGTITPVAFMAPFSVSNPGFVNNQGSVVGTTNRYAGDSMPAPATSLGTSAWIYRAGVTTEIGLLDSNHSYTLTTNGTTGRFSTNSVNGLTDTVAGLTDTGYISGSANAYYDIGNGTATALGNDGWASDGTTTTAVGLYARGIAPNVDSAAVDTYRYYQTPTGTLGMTAATSQSRQTTMVASNAAGQLIGSSSYYGTSGFKGGDAFVYSIPKGTYRQLGFFSNGFTTTTPAVGVTSYVSTSGNRTSAAAYINARGDIVGTSTLYQTYSGTGGTSTVASGTVAWTDSGSGPTRIGLFGQAGDKNAAKHVNPQTGVAIASVTNLTESGLVGGTSARYYLATTGVGTQYGSDAWVYNPTTGKTSLVAPDATFNDVYVSTAISYLSEDGYAVGQYTASTTLASSGGFGKAFVWSLAGGFVDLGTNLSPALTASGYQNLINGLYSTTGGGTLYATASTTASTTINGIVTLTTVLPEPASIAALAAGSLVLVRRRRLA